MLATQGAAFRFQTIMATYVDLDSDPMLYLKRVSETMYPAFFVSLPNWYMIFNVPFAEK